MNTIIHLFHLPLTYCISIIFQRCNVFGWSNHRQARERASAVIECSLFSQPIWSTHGWNNGKLYERGDCIDAAQYTNIILFSR